jgi:hypothetical protein
LTLEAILVKIIKSTLPDSPTTIKVSKIFFFLLQQKIKKLWERNSKAIETQTQIKTNQLPASEIFHEIYKSGQTN